MSSSQQWFIKTQSGRSGPFGFQELQYFADRGKIKPNTAVRHDDSSWIKAKRIEGLFFAGESPAGGGHDEPSVMPDSADDDPLTQSSPFAVAPRGSELDDVFSDSSGEALEQNSSPHRASTRHTNDVPVDRPHIATARETELSDREAVIADREAKLAGREAELARREHEFADREADLAVRESSLRDRQSKFDSLELEFSSRQSEVACREGDVELRETELFRREAELRCRESQLLARESKAAEGKSK